MDAPGFTHHSCSIGPKAAHNRVLPRHVQTSETNRQAASDPFIYLNKQMNLIGQVFDSFQIVLIHYQFCSNNFPRDLRYG